MQHQRGRDVCLSQSRHIPELGGVVLAFKVVLVAHVVGQLPEGLGVEVLWLDGGHVAGVAWD